MTKTTRRDFLRAAATTAAAGAATSLLPSSILRALAIDATRVTGTIDDVEHIVILMLENRSFDHYFGTLKGVRGFGDRFPIPLASGKSVWSQSDGTRDITPFRLDMNHMNALKVQTTSHDFADTQAAWNQGKYGFWPKFKVDLKTGEATGHSMGYYTREELPFQFALAEAFTLCDNYHCSVLGGTDPNRIAFFSGSNFDPVVRARGDHQTPRTSEPTNLRCWVEGTWPKPGYVFQGEPLDWPTIPDVLERAGISYRIYQNPNDNFRGSMHGCLAFKSFREAQPGSSRYLNGMSAWSLEDLASHVQDATLPRVSWVLPSQAQCEHAEGSGPASGADFTNRVLAALVSNPGVWSKTVLFVTFDENDGYFDHVPPPVVPSFNPDGTLAGASTLNTSGMYFDATGVNRHEDVLYKIFYGTKQAQMVHYIDPVDRTSGMIRPFGMGPRVPMYVVSPWSKGGWVCSQVFDHTSVAQFIERRFRVEVPAISPWNRAVSGDLTSALDFAITDRPTFQVDPAIRQLPDTSGYHRLEMRQKTLPNAVAPVVLPAFAQEPGPRRSRPTPYELHVDAKLNAMGTLTLRFANTGRQGAVFHVYDQLHLDRIPRRYTVEAGKALDDGAWKTGGDGGMYDLLVYSTNGFLRAFKGDLAMTGGAALELHVGYDPARGVLRTQLRNLGSGPVEARIVDNAYHRGGPWSIALDANQTYKRAWKLIESGNWYDFTISAPGFERRFAGRMEDGRNSISDPAMAGNGARI